VIVMTDDDDSYGLWPRIEIQLPEIWLKTYRARLVTKKNFLKYSSHQIFGHMYGTLNINKKLII